MSNSSNQSHVGFLHIDRVSTFALADSEKALDAALDQKVRDVLEDTANFEQAWNENIDLKIDIGETQALPGATVLMMARPLSLNQNTLFALGRSEGEAAMRLSHILEEEACRRFPLDEKFLEHVHLAPSVEVRAALLGMDVHQATDLVISNAMAM